MRSLAFDIGERLGCGAHLAALQRERIGTFHVGQSLHVESLEDAEDVCSLTRHLVSISDALQHLPAVRIDRNGRMRIAHGMLISWQDVIEPDRWDRLHNVVRILDEEKRCIAIGKIDGLSDISHSHLCPKRVFI